MDSFEVNKIVGAILGTLLFVMGIGFVAEAIYSPIEGRGPGYALPEPEAGGHGDAGQPAVVAEATPLPALLASASVDSGAKVAKKCLACHNFEQGAGNKTGPALYDVVGRPIASHETYAFSDALKGVAAQDQNWSYEFLNEFLASPKTFAPGTKMTFAGLSSDKDRADLLAYLQTLSAAPVPFPAADSAAH